MATKELKDRKGYGMKCHSLRSLCSFATENLFSFSHISRVSRLSFLSVPSVKSVVEFLWLRLAALCSLCSLAAESAFSFSRVSGVSRLILLLFPAFTLSAQTTPPPVSYFRSYVNDLPNAPLVTVTITGASNVSCLTIEEDLPAPASPVSGSVSGDGVWLPSIGAIRWGPYFNTVATNVSYRLTGLAGSYPVNGGSWMDGEWYFSPSNHYGDGLVARPRPLSFPASASRHADILADQRRKCPDKCDHFLRDDERRDLLHA